MPERTKAEAPIIMADAAFLIDASSGKILYENQSNTPLGIAEITKMMTTYIVLEQIKKGTISWEDEVTISNYTYTLAQNENIRTVNLSKDFTYTVKALYEAMVVYNANDATIALVEAVAGSEQDFLKLMNDKAKELNLSGYKFVNTTGLNNSLLLDQHPEGTGPSDENVMSARSVAKLAYYLYKDFPELLDSTKQPKIWFNKGMPHTFEVTNWNQMLPGLAFGYNGTLGLFGGYSPFAGYSMVSMAKRGDKELIAVVMKASDEQFEESEQALYEQTSQLLEYGFTQFERVEIVPAGYEVPGQETIAVIKGQSNKVTVQTDKPMYLMLKADELELYKPVLVLHEPYVEAPVEKGRSIGMLIFERTKGQDFGFITGEAILGEMVVGESVNGASKWQLVLQGIGAFWKSFWHASNELLGNE